MIDRLIFLLIIAGLSYAEAEAVAKDVLTEDSIS